MKITLRDGRKSSYLGRPSLEDLFDFGAPGTEYAQALPQMMPPQKKGAVLIP